MAYRPPPPFTTSMTVTVMVDDEEQEVEVNCEFDYTPEDKGSWSGGQQMEPDYPATADLLSAKDADGKDWANQLSDAERERLEIDAAEKASEPVFDEPDDDSRWHDHDDYIGPD